MLPVDVQLRTWQHIREIVQAVNALQPVRAEVSLIGRDHLQGFVIPEALGKRQLDLD